MENAFDFKDSNFFIFCNIDYDRLSRTGKGPYFLKLIYRYIGKYMSKIKLQYIPTQTQPITTTTARISICVSLCDNVLKKGFQKSSNTTAAIELSPVDKEL